MEIRRKESIRPKGSIRRRDSLKSPPPAQEVSVSLLGNGDIGIAVVDGLPTNYHDGVISALDEQEEDDEELTQLAVTCRVCNNEIIIDKEEGFVVKCGICNEATVSGP